MVKERMRPLTSLDALDAALATAHTQPILLFKHSETCGLSLQANAEMEAFVADAGHGVPVYLVSVQRGRPVSNAIAERLGVRHASPQLLLVRDDAVLWHTSHLAITVDAIRAALERFTLTAR
jgi:thioredoxin 1